MWACFPHPFVVDSFSAVATIASIVVLSLPSESAFAQTDGDGSLEAAAQELVERYAPVIAVAPQAEPCDPSGEQYTPTSPDIVLDNPHVVLRQIGVGDPVLVVGPTARDLFDTGESFYIDFPGNAFDPGCAYEGDFLRYNQGRNAVVYAHVATQPDHPNKLAVQYWFFYYYNNYNNLHEGDWEGIQLLFDVGTVDQALEAEPTSIGYSQHFGGELAQWDDAKLELADSTHPVVYPGLGSHASYFESALFLGRSGSEGFGCDTTLDATRRLEPDVVLLPDDVDDPDDPLAWLTFEGLWGERRFEAFSGATGPITKPRWTEPVDWHETLRDESVVVPEADGSAVPYVNRFCEVVAFGSSQYLAAREQPVRTTSIVVALGLVLWFLLGRTEWTATNPAPIVAKRRLGQILVTAGRLYWSHRWKLLLAAFVQLPLAVLAAVIVAISNVATEPLGPLGQFIAGVVAVVLNVLVYLVVMTALLRAVAGFDGSLSDLSVAGTYRWAASKLAILAETLLRGGLIIVGLAITIVGIPWAIRQYVRYQVATATIVWEDRSPRDALRRCSQLIRGRERWWHTALVVLSLQVFVGLLGAAAGVLALILVSGFPLEFYSLVALLGGVLVLPYLAASTALLYGNVVAESAEDDSDVVAEPAAN